jgi:flagellar protein FlaJ
MSRRLPFIPFPLKMAKLVVKPFYGLGNRLSKLFPGLNVRLSQTDIDMSPREYLAIAFFALWFWTTIIFVILLTFSLFITLPENFVYVLTIAPLVIGFLAFFYILQYPMLIISKKIRDLDRHLLFALRHMQVQVKSGIPLFDGLVSISKGDYGLITEEFKKCVKKISTGMSETNALEDLIFKNPSIYFRRVIWQITNAMRTGADLANTLDAIVENLADEQKVAIRRYGSQLNPLSMMYMMLAVILPSLGITFLVLLSTFSGFTVSEVIFWFILTILIVFQFSFVGLVKSRRPTIEL